jgi:diguanylate cyclase (GGDEF)-like protein
MLYDSLTGLPNAVLFVDRLQQALAHAARRKQQVGLVYLDIDRFRQLISAHGIACGDAALRELAARLRQCAERQEDTVARLCGDQFVLVLGDVDGVSGVRTVLNKIAAAVRREFVLDKVAATVTLSAGASVSPRDGKEWSELLRCASISMRQAKNAGGDCYFCYGETGAAHASEAQDLAELLPPNLSGAFWANDQPARLGGASQRERMLG